MIAPFVGITLIRFIGSERLYAPSQLACAGSPQMAV